MSRVYWWMKPKSWAPSRLTADELTSRKASLVGGYGRAIETSAGLANVLTSDALYGVDLKDVGLYPQKVEAVGPDEARAAASVSVDPSRASLIVVGDAKQFLGKLKIRYPNVEVIEASDLDLGVASLVKGQVRWVAAAVETLHPVVYPFMSFGSYKVLRRRIFRTMFR